MSAWRASLLPSRAAGETLGPGCAELVRHVSARRGQCRYHMSEPDSSTESTVTLRTVSNKYTRSLLVDQLNRFRCVHDYLYFPLVWWC